MLGWDGRKKIKGLIQSHSFKAEFPLVVCRLEWHLPDIQAPIFLFCFLIQLFLFVLYRQHVTRRRGRYCWRVTDVGSQSCTTHFRMTTIWYIWTWPINAVDNFNPPAIFLTYPHSPSSVPGDGLLCRGGPAYST